jgi:hypothetical protein
VTSLADLLILDVLDDMDIYVFVYFFIYIVLKSNCIFINFY